MRLASSKECTGCMACVDACPHTVLKATIDINGYYAIVPDSEKQCTECGKCSQICPVLNQTQTTGESVPYAAWNKDSEQRKQSASGGIFAALATSIIRKGGSVYGAAIEGFDVKHLRITDECELHRLQGSKYQHSDMTGIYMQVRNDLRQGMYVLFSGLGCQVAGLLSFLGKTKKEKLYTIDTICGGLSTMLPMLHLKTSGKYKGISSFRDKENGWQSKGFRYSLKMVRKDGSVEDLGLDNLVLNTFSSKLLKRSSCLDCKFVGLHRNSDCTIGDFWGNESFKEQHHEGLSVLIAHNERIISLMRETHIEAKPVSWKEVITDNRNIYWTHYPLIRYFFSRKKALLAMQEKDYVIATKQMSPWSFPGLLLRIYLKINMLYRSVH
ncbi:Coenzyme F420 hydrogenase/dehydrogenase, beta subunit C-terminal domain [Bacteroides uniformis]|uniref:Coenzyme F420 hydrogenase/dehydrogenase, beta subunit C-terminal domain n=1 Tax=Bacteroides uniformis TaxID=820 RepID=UPI0039B6E64F